MTSLKWVVDTNVLISAALSTQGGPAQLVQRLLADHVLVFSAPTFEELRTRLCRPKFDRYISFENRQRLLRDFSAAAHWVDVGDVRRHCKDPDDDVFFETAQQAKAYAIVSGDSDVLKAPALTGLIVLTVHQALEHL